MSAAPVLLEEVLSRETIPPLEAGDRLTRAEFLRRYEAMPHISKAQLIEGIVYMPSPVNFVKHGEPHSTINLWLGYYASKTPGVRLGDNATTELDEDNVPQPDLLLRLPEKAGGGSRINENGYIEGPPELIVEVSSSSVSIDLNAKLNAYRRNSVPEYVVWRVRDRAVDWFVLTEGQYMALSPDPADGLIKSKVFPYLWLDAKAMLAQDLPNLLQGVDRGCATNDHVDFVRRLAQVESR